MKIMKKNIQKCTLYRKSHTRFFGSFAQVNLNVHTLENKKTLTGTGKCQLHAWVIEFIYQHDTCSCTQ